MLSRRILTITGVGLAICAWFGLWNDDSRFLIPLGICILIGILAYTFQHQIDWWATNRRTPKLDSPMKLMLQQTNPFYNHLSNEDQAIFEKRMVLWVQAKEFIMQGGEKFPEDLKFSVAAYAVMLTFHRTDFLFKGIDRVVFYQHAFLTPQHADDVHACEVELTDGVFIFAMQQMMHGHLKPQQYYNILIHTFAEAYRLKYDGERLPNIPEDFWPKLQVISNISKEKIEAFIGFELTDPWPTTVHHYFVYPTYFKGQAPQVFADIRNWHENIVLAT